MAVTDQPVDGIRRNRSIELLNYLEDGVLYRFDVLVSRSSLPPGSVSRFLLTFR
jgi:hypothetical protein